MCLEVVHKHPVPLSLVIRGYKIMGTDLADGYYSPVVNHAKTYKLNEKNYSNHVACFSFRLGRWIAKKIHNYDRDSYPRGFHVFAFRRDAEQFFWDLKVDRCKDENLVLVEVELTGIVAKGRQRYFDFGETYVGLQMTITKVLPNVSR